MKIRTQLILAFLLLSVVPLSGIVLYSYYSSEKAVRSAMQAEAERMARELDGRVTQVRDEVSDRVASLSRDVDFETMIAEGSGDGLGDPAAGRIASAMAPVAPFVESLEFIPNVAAILADTAVEVSEGDFAAFGNLAAFAEMGKLGELGTEEGRAAFTESLKAQMVPPVPPVPRPGEVPRVAPAPPSPPAVRTIVIDVGKIVSDVSMQLERTGMPMTPERERELRARLEELERSHENEASGMMEEIELHNRAAGQREREALETARRTAALVARARQQAEEIRSRDALAPRPAGVSAPRAARPEPAPRQAVRVESVSKTREHHPGTSNLFGDDLRVPVTRRGEVVGSLEARVRPDLLIRSILELSDSESGEIPFAIDRKGFIHAKNEPARDKVKEIVVDPGEGRTAGRRVRGNWVVATSVDDESGLTLGILRPTREPLEQVRRAAGQNFAYGLGLIGIALIGIIPLANHMTRDVELVTEGAERIAQGDLDTEVPIRSSNEFGTLAVAFNKMARDLREHQAQIVAQEQRRKEQEIQQHLLAADFARKSAELEEARRFQLSLLPKQLPRIPGIEIAVHMRTATEVGGDYYDFHVHPESGDLTIALGDATGHGVRAGTMVTIVKSLFSSYGGGREPSEFLAEAGKAIRGMELGRMAMAFMLGRIAGRRLTISSAGMPPVLLHRARSRRIEELAMSGMPLGSFGGEFEDRVVDLEAGDTLLFLSDGFPELLDSRGDPLGYVAVENAFGVVAGGTPEEIIEALSRAADQRTGGEPPNDDITFVVVRVA
ncbi:MAG: PP2C family protein-serine/threonine phosphatase [Thermoanaerobaculia bacterium]